MTITIIGAANIGGTLAEKWKSAGHDILIGARNPNEEETLKRAQSIGARVMPIAEAVKSGDAVLIATPNLPVLETKKTKIERIAAMKPTTAKYFSWCPREYVKGWLEASAKGTILQQGRLKQPPPYQGAGLYCVSSPMKSCMWADETKESVCLVIDMVNVPTICKHDIEQMQLLADPLNSISIDEAAFEQQCRGRFVVPMDIWWK